MNIELQSINLISDTTMHLETQYFDERGNMIESISPGSRGRFDRRLYRYDTLDRRILYRGYDKSDTTKYYSETKWIYIDSNKYRQEHYYEGKLTQYTESVAESNGDTLWVTKDEHRLEFDKHDHKVSRFRTIGDSLQISEFIKYDDSLRLSGVDTYFHLKRDIDTGYLIMAGQYIVKSSEWDQFHFDRNLMRDFYAHPDKYIQMQLDGEFEMEYHDDPHTYQIYNYQDQLIQDSYGIYKTTFEYNDQGQLVKATRWGEKEGESYGGVVEHGFVFYEYDERGFPIKVTEQSLKRDVIRVYYYSYSF